MQFDQLKRREFITLVGCAAVAWPLAASAQQQPKILRVGFVGIQPREAPVYTNFLKRMAELGYQEGRNFTFDYIQTPDVEGYERNYRELATRKVDVFLAVGTERALRAALLAAEGKPIVLLAIDFDPVARGYVASLSRPGGSVTGIFVRRSSSPPNASKSRARRSRARLCSESPSTPFRASNVMRRPRRPASWGLSRA
jgi:putative ABC transport system substrate-binding protein